jgi:hypothetical protein
MFSVILYMLRQTVGHRTPPCPFHLFSSLTVTFPKLSVILRPLYLHGNYPNETKVAGNSSASLCVTTVAQQSFHVTLCVTSNLKQRYFSAEPQFPVP